MVMSEDEAVHLFSYGTLQQSDVQLSTFGRLLKGKTNSMPGKRQACGDGRLMHIANRGNAG